MGVEGLWSSVTMPQAKSNDATAHVHGAVLTATAESCSQEPTLNCLHPKEAFCLEYYFFPNRVT